MNNSIDFVKSRISSGGLKLSPALDEKQLTLYDFGRLVANMSEDIRRVYRNNTFDLTLDTTDDDGKHKRRVVINHDPSASFDFVHMESCICDGTMLFMFELLEKSFHCLLKSEIYNKETVPDDYLKNFWDYDIFYTIGDFVCESDNSKEYGTKEKPWMTQRFVVLLPVKVEVKKREDISAK